MKFLRALNYAKRVDPYSGNVGYLWRLRIHRWELKVHWLVVQP